MVKKSYLAKKDKELKLEVIKNLNPKLYDKVQAGEMELQDVNVLENPEIRVKLSEYSNWPTIPQLFINSELVGGADIAIEMHNSGELETVLDLCLANQVEIEKK